MIFCPLKYFTKQHKSFAKLWFPDPFRNNETLKGIKVSTQNKVLFHKDADNNNSSGFLIYKGHQWSIRLFKMKCKNYLTTNYTKSNQENVRHRIIDYFSNILSQSKPTKKLLVGINIPYFYSSCLKFLNVWLLNYLPSFRIGSNWYDNLYQPIYQHWLIYWYWLI